MFSSMLILSFITGIVFYICYQMGYEQLLIDINNDKRNCPVYKDISTVKDCGLKCPKFIPPKDPLKLYHYGEESVIFSAFSSVYHPDPPVDSELYLTRNNEWKSIDSCKSIYLMRAACRTDMPSTCAAIAFVPEIYTTPTMNIYRYGSVRWPQILTNQYQDDIIHPHGYFQQKLLLHPLLQDLSDVIAQFKEILGDPMNSDGTRKTAIIMVANEGVLDLVMNIMCSARSAKINTENVVIFLGQKEYIPLVQNMGYKAIYHKALGEIPPSAAGNYADVIFGYLMWFKTTSVYTAARAGFDVLFVDSDVVWFRDPLPFLRTLKEDIIFMDDGARSPRFSPFFFNSGFYFMKYNERTLYLQERMIKTIGEITYTHSHQTTLTRYIAEAMYLFGLQILILRKPLFPSGQMYHRDKKYIQSIIDKEIVPYVFHMCWTANRNDKVQYLKEIGMWYLPDPSEQDGICEHGATMKQYFESHPSVEMAQKCCTLGSYWTT